MIVGFYQCPSPKGDLHAGLATVEKALGEASDAKVDMLVLPEAFLPGYGATTQTKPAEWNTVANRLSKLCRRYTTALTIGLPEYNLGQVFNTAVVIGPDGGTLAHYRKIQLFGSSEKEIYVTGNRYVAFNYRGKRWGLLICYDVEFPEHVRALARAGAEIVLVPTANMMPFVNVNQIMVPSRAAENGINIVYANYSGSEGGISYTGMSSIYGSDGSSLVSSRENTGLYIAELPDSRCKHGIPLSTQLADLQQLE
ncbi:(R)-stereoselective amidase [Roseovarius albus]|uniref:(R)-stereoselective amidase n=1 Tax=Roseovarius albus TaxID=1247867 RepID=A0A1X6YHL7_9RHOB|nr:carbon-nitrogen hydrolase family protein [Roseovarius albus]SLN21309.1 (R)-stereoselective amidase [Roseovarius albus]